MVKYLSILCAILGVALVFAISRCSSARENTETLEKNQELLLDSCKQLVTNIDSSVAKIQALQLTSEQLSKSNLDLLDKIKEQDLKLSRVNSAQQTVSKSHYIIKVDTIKEFVSNSTLNSPVEVKFSDNYIDFSCLIDSNFVADIVTFDTITRIEYRYPRKLLWVIPFGTKYVGETFISSNPHTKITGATSVVLTNKKK